MEYEVLNVHILSFSVSPPSLLRRRELLSFSSASGGVQLWAYGENGEPYSHLEETNTPPIVTYRLGGTEGRSRFGC